MRNAILFTVFTAIHLASNLPAIADTGSGKLPLRANTAVNSDRAPRLEELRKLGRPAPTGTGAERKVPNVLVPERLRQSVENRVSAQILEPSSAAVAVSQVVGQAPVAALSFGGFDSDDNATLFGFRIMPPDTEGDVGPNHYVQFNNLGFKIFDKSGNLLNGPDGDPGNLPWAGFGGSCETENDGDPIVLYDEQAGRWLFSQFEVSVNGLQCVAISDGDDPAGPYTRYAFPISLDGFNDYPKIGVWTTADGSQSAYHITTNEFGPTDFLGVNLTALDRDAMLAGDPAASFVQFTISPDSSPERFAFSLQPAHLEGSELPPPGTCETYIQVFDSETWGVPGDTDGYRTWEFCVDFAVPDNSSLTENPLVPAGIDFDSNLCNFAACVPQPNGQQLDTLSQFTMYRYSVRDVDGMLSGVVTHTIDVRSDVAGLQWAKLSLGGASPSLVDLGQYFIPDRRHRWMPSASQDKEGNIAIGYSRSSRSDFPSVYFTGRESSDPEGSLQAESVCIDGTGSQSGGTRWGDYSSVSIDPADDCTFWITNEYVETTGNFQWDTQICTFSFPSCGGGGGGTGDPVPPPAPGNLTATGGRIGTNLFVDLAWIDNSSGTGQETEFVIERTTQTGSRGSRQCGTFSAIASTLADATSYQDSGLARRTTYCYRVFGRNAGGDGEPSNVVTVRPR